MIEKWECLGCSATLGFIEDKSIIRIKRKDLYVEIDGGKVTTLCYKCGKRNGLSFNQDRYLKQEGGD